jgi:hypothetical protein
MWVLPRRRSSTSWMWTSAETPRSYCGNDRRRLADGERAGSRAKEGQAERHQNALKVALTQAILRRVEASSQPSEITINACS